MQSQIKVKAPGSSANLGPGFDCLGIALGRYVEASNVGDGDPCDNNSIIRAAYLEAGGREQVWFKHNLEPGRGLGFSAAARAVGAAVGFMEQGRTLEECRDDVYRVTASLEGHGDNAAPSVYGGLNIVSANGVRQVKATSLDSIVLWIASQQSSTDKSRKAIPNEIPLVDAVSNIANVALLMSCLYEGDFDSIGSAFEDKIHQDRRLESSPSSAKALQIGKDFGVQAGWLSGAGPSVAFIAPSKDHDRLIEVLPDDGLSLSLKIDTCGICLVD